MTAASHLHENAQLQSDSAPYDRELPDFVSLDEAGSCEVVPLRNGGRLLVEPRMTEAKAELIVYLKTVGVGMV